MLKRMVKRDFVLSLIFMFLLAYFVYAAVLTASGVERASPIPGQNISGVTFNLSVSLRAINAPAGVDSINQTSNVTFMWWSVNNNSLTLNMTLGNASAAGPGSNFSVAAQHNYTVFNHTFNTNILPDGIYNITIFIYNMSYDFLSFTHLENQSAINISIDNVAPVLATPNPANLTNFTTDIVNATTRIVAFNISVQESPVPNVYFIFDNSTGADANDSKRGTNRSGIWNYDLDLQNLTEGKHTLTLFVNSSHKNTTQVFNFTIDRTAPFTPNVSGGANNTGILTYFGGNGVFTVLGGNYTVTGEFGATIGFNNQSLAINLTDTNLTVETVLFSFDNATGTGFNISATNSSGNWSINYNLSNLVEGRHSITLFANDTVGNLNKTFTINFTVDSRAPEISGFSLASGKKLQALNVSGASGGTSSLNFSVNFTVKDNVSGIRLVIVSIVNATGSVQVNATATNTSTLRNASQDNNQSGGSDLLNGTLPFSALLNFSGLEEGTHIISIYAYDYVNNTRIFNSSLIVDRTAPTITLEGVSEEITDTQIKVRIKTTSDAQTCTANRGTVSGSGVNQELVATGLDATTSYVFEVTCKDDTDPANSRSVSETFTTTSSGGSGGSSGGSGGGSSSGVSGQFETKIWTSILAGETASISVEGDAVGVTEISFAVEKTVYSPFLKVEKVTLPLDKPFDGKVYASIKITEVNIQKVLKGMATVGFKVPNEWLKSNNLGKNGVGLFRHADNAWQELKTTAGTDDGTYTYFTAETPGFSYFVIGEKEEAAEAEKGAQPAPAPTTEEKAPEESVSATGSNTVAWVVAVIVVLGLLAWWYFRKK